jgi:VTC domain
MRVDCVPGNSNRFENKYALPGNLARQVLAYTRLFLPADRGLDRPQLVTSLYLDTPDLTFYHWHNDRRSDRFKLRIRGYGQPPGKTVYFEIKGKNGELVRKRRAAIAQSKLHEVVAGVEPANSPILWEFLRLHNEFDAGPRMLVRCMRTAFRDYNLYGEVAVTADREIVCQPVWQYELAGNPQAWEPITLPEESNAIVELKFVGGPPTWMVSLMSNLAKYRVSFSKYGAAMDQHVERPEFLLQKV